MNTRSPATQKALVIVLLCAGLGLLAIQIALPDTSSSAPAGNLPPPRLAAARSTRPPARALADSPALTIAPTPYRHPSGAFTVIYPDVWQVDESEDAALFTAPDDSAQISASFTNTNAAGQLLPPAPDLPALGAQELQAAWGDLSSFTVDSVDAYSGHRWEAYFHFDQSIVPNQPPQRMNGHAIYLFQDSFLYTLTLLARTDAQPELADTFDAIIQSFIIDPQAALNSSSE